MEQEKKITFRASPLWIGLMLVLALALGGGLYYFSSSTAGNERAIKQLESKNKKAQSEVITLNASYANPQMEEVRNSTDAIRNSMIQGAEADAVVSSLRPKWTVLSRTDEENSEFIHRRYTLVRGISPVREWPEILGAFHRLAGVANLALNSFNIETLGDSRQRSFSRITVNISVYIRKPDLP